MNKYYSTICASVLCAVLMINSGVKAEGPAERETYIFSVAPQQSASKTASRWLPILRYLSEKTGYKFRLKTSMDAPAFEESLREGGADFSYMNPLHYVLFHEKYGYTAIARAKDRRMKGIVVVHKDSPIQTLEELSGLKLAFPSPTSFAASLLPRAYMNSQNIEITPQYVTSHDSVYLNVAKGRFVAGGGVMKSLQRAAPEVRENVRVLWASDGYTPHAVVANSTVDPKIINAVQQALVSLHDYPNGLAMLNKIMMKSFTAAQDSDWDDVRRITTDKR